MNEATVLKTILENKKKRNPSYSLRSFARDLKVSATALSQVMNGKRSFSKKNCEKILNNLNLSPIEKERFLKGKADLKTQKFLQIEDDQFQFISHWYYVAVLMQFLKKEKPGLAKISNNLGIEKSKVSNAIKTLKRLKLLIVDGKGLKPCTGNFKTTIDNPSRAIKNHHRENLELAAFALENVNVEDREISSMTLNIDPGKIEEAKKHIVDFKRKFCKKVEKDDGDLTYTLCVQFFPTSLKEKK
ncbi:MAG: TIGR02147 family protein [Bacteriovoracaceae bacterium]|jgi:uncharacterized protein (TIGR02147 family)|nr:TIGR02147 family protein [Bacteriovoracaceae bacterium]